MKKTIITALLAISMAACTNQQQAQRCELFGVSLGMERDEVYSILIERFGKGESYGKDGSFYYEDIFYDGIKYSSVDFGFVDGKLSHIYCHCDKSVEFSNIEKFEDNTREVWKNIHELDSVLAQKHRIYNNPVSRGLTDGNVVTFAVKDAANAIDYIAVSVHRHEWSYNNTENVNLILHLIEAEKIL